MEARAPHRWDLSPKQAAALQSQLRDRLVKTDRLGTVRTVAGADIALDKARGVGYGGVIVYSFPDLREIERVPAECRLTFPYIPGLLAFREGPVLLEAFRRLRAVPDLLLFDAHGYSHPRRFGLASHLAYVLDTPGIGVAKSRLIGAYQEPPDRQGAWTPLVDGEETIGAVVRTRAGVQPIFVSIGHRVSLETAVKLALASTDGFHIPKPTREADHYVGQLKRGVAPQPAGNSAAQSALF